MSLGLVVEVALRILRRQWPALLLLATLFAGPGALLTAAATMRFDSVAQDVLPGIDRAVFESGALLTVAEVQRLAEAFVAYLAATIVAGVIASIGAVGFSSIVLADYEGRPAGFRAALLSSLRRAPSVVVFAAVTTVLVVGVAVAAVAAMSLSVSVLSGGDVQGGGPGVFLALVIVVASIVLIAYLTVRWALAYPVMAFEAAGWRSALQRSWRLASDNMWRVFAIVVIGLLATVFISALVSQLLAIIVVDIVAGSIGLDTAVAESVVIALGTVLLAPLAPVLLAVLAVDLRRQRQRDPRPTPG